MLAKIISLVEGLDGIVAVKPLDRSNQDEILKIEGVYEQSTVLPLKNLGAEIAAGRDQALVLLKDARFRQPPAPTVYMVEETEDSRSGDHILHIDGRHYRVIGEEILNSGQKYYEKIMPLGNSFILFPERRSNGRTPAIFLVPPLPFQELEEQKGHFRIENIVSISPSIMVDSYLRETFGFPQERTLATLLVAYNRVS